MVSNPHVGIGIALGLFSKVIRNSALHGHSLRKQVTKCPLENSFSLCSHPLQLS